MVGAYCTSINHSRHQSLTNVIANWSSLHYVLQIVSLSSIVCSIFWQFRNCFLRSSRPPHQLHQSLFMSLLRSCDGLLLNERKVGKILEHRPEYRLVWLKPFTNGTASGENSIIIKPLLSQRSSSVESRVHSCICFLLYHGPFNSVIQR